MAAGVLTGCADVTRMVDSKIQAERGAGTQAAIGSECASPAARARSFGAATNGSTVQLSLAIGDTTRLSRAWLLSGDGAPSPSTAWRVEDIQLARVEGDLVIPLAPGRTRVTATVGVRTMCVLLTTLFTGVTVTTLSVNRTPIQVARDATSRVDAVLRYSNGIAVHVREAVVWTSLDPSVAGVSRSAWITPVGVGTARIVASVGLLSDTANVQVTDQRFEAISPRRASEFTGSIGVNVHLSYFDLVYGTGFYSIILPRLQELGVRQLRDGGTTLPNEDWMREVYGRWRAVADATGAQFTVIMSPRRTATGPGTDYGDMSHIRELRNRIGAEHISAFEGLNEHDISGRPDYAREVRVLQRAMYEVVKGDADMAARYRVLGPSIVNVATSSQVGDLSAYMDEGAIHPYDGGQIPTTNLRRHVDGIGAVSGARPLEATEVGYHTSAASTNPYHWALSETAQAKYTLRQFLELFNFGIRRSFAYEFIDEGTDPTDMEHNFGLLRNDGSRKPAFVGLRNLIALLDDRSPATYTTRPLRVRFFGDTIGVHHLVLQKADGRRYIVLWQNTLSYDKDSRRDVTGPIRSVGLEFDATMTSATVYVPLNGATSTAVFGQVRTVYLNIPDHPIVLELVD